MSVAKHDECRAEAAQGDATEMISRKTSSGSQTKVGKRETSAERSA